MNGQSVSGELRDDGQVTLVCPQITGGVGGAAHYVLVM